MNLDRLRKVVDAKALKSWEGEVAEAHLLRARQILDEAGRNMLELAANPQKEELVGVIDRAVRALNEADEPDHFIMTIEREDLCEHLGNLGAAAGLSDAEIDRGLSGRDW